MISFSTALNSGAPVMSSAFISFASAAVHGFSATTLPSRQR
jgi:hypothetical protein